MTLLRSFVTLCLVVSSAATASASQNELVPPTSGIYTGVQFSQKIGDAFKSLAGGNKGPASPANVEGATVDGMRWIDDTTSLWLKKTYVNGGWASEGAYNAADSSWVGIIGGGLASLASGSTVDLGSVPQANVEITGTATITGFGSSAPAGIVKIIRFDDALKLTNSAALAIPCGFDLTTAAKDRAIVTHLGEGAWEVTQYTRASGIPIDCSAVGKADFTFAGAVPPLHVPGDGRALTRTAYPAYLAAVTVAQSGTRTSGNATITSVTSTARMGVGMPVEGIGIGSGCTVASLVANTSITLDSSSCVTSSGTATVTVFLTGYGSGGDSTKVGVKDCTGRTLAGRETSPSRLTSSYFGADSTAIGAAGGSQSHMLKVAELAQHSHTATPTNDSSTFTLRINGFQTTIDRTGVASFQVNPGPVAVFSAIGDSQTPSVTIPGGGLSLSTSISNTGSSDPHTIVQPTMIADCVVRVTP